jgi:hypothetical protein
MPLTWSDTLTRHLPHERRISRFATATARFVVTLPPEPSKLAKALRKDIGAAFTALTSTDDAFRHLALRAKGRLVIMIPFIDRFGAEWAVELFGLTEATERILVIRDARQLDVCGGPGIALTNVATRIVEYGSSGDDPATDETFSCSIRRIREFASSLERGESRVRNAGGRSSSPIHQGSCRRRSRDIRYWRWVAWSACRTNQLTNCTPNRTDRNSMSQETSGHRVTQRFRIVGR